MKEEVRRPAVAGAFYPADAQTLSQQVRDLLARAPKPEIPGDIMALVSPHAGYIYSGRVAAAAFKLIQGMEYEAVIVVAPSHRAVFQGGSIYDRGGYETPLGVVPIEKELCQKLQGKSPFLRFLSQGHTQEHSLEVQLPFLQEALGSFRLVPIVLGDQSYRTCEMLGQTIASAVEGKKVLLVASTDLSHFHSYEEAVRRDQVILEDLRAFDPQRMSRTLESGKGEACGGGAMMTVMVASKALGADQSRVLQYINSGDVTGDRSGVVGYTAAVFYRKAPSREKEPEDKRKAGISLGLTEEEKKNLRQIARAAIEGQLRGNRPSRNEAPSGHLKEKRGAFVSLHRHGKLRGCIGLIHPTKPLHQSVEEMAIAAAFDDPRFGPLTLKEAADVELEISVLTPLQRIKDVAEIQVGIHGLYIKKGAYSGLLLPQVATQYHWDRNTFLEETCRKAGLSKNSWKEKDTEIYLFSADIF
jgi:MEMO1 family protein